MKESIRFYDEADHSQNSFDVDFSRPCGSLMDGFKGSTKLAALTKFGEMKIALKMICFQLSIGNPKTIYGGGSSIPCNKFAQFVQQIFTSH